MGNEVNEHKIMTMDEEKRNRILNAAMKEFSKGYKKASTDNMVKEAGISKGLLYHYFGTKKGVLSFLYDYAIQVIMKEFIAKIDLKETDYFERLWNMTLDKLELTYKYPSVFEFITLIYLSEEEEFKVLKAQLLEIQENQWRIDDEKLFADIDVSLFKEGIDVQKVMDVVRWTLLGYSEQLLKKYPTVKDYQLQYDEILKEIRAYMDFFRKNFYT